MNGNNLYWKPRVGSRYQPVPGADRNKLSWSKSFRIASYATKISCSFSKSFSP